VTKNQEITLRIQSLNERGYGVGEFEDQPVLILNSLPGELVRATVFKKKQGLVYGKAEEILESSPFRKESREEHYFACSPWQILDYNEENKVKHDFITQAFNYEANFELPNFEVTGQVDNIKDHYHYRNKVEFSFFGFDDESLMLAYFMREGNFGKYPHRGCLLVTEQMNIAANKILDFLNAKKILAKQLKSLVLRHSFSTNKVVASLYCKDEELKFKDEELKNLLDDTFTGIVIVHSSRKSPASIVTSINQEIGLTQLTEKVLDVNLSYNFDSFFQVNPPAFELAASDILKYIQANHEAKNSTLVDLYAGVGTIGLTLAKYVKKVVGVEVSSGSQKIALLNAKNNDITNFEFIEASAENALQTIDQADFLVVDPPRTGLWFPVMEKILASKPKFIIYLSCNPRSLAANFAKLKEFYELEFVRGYNFYPHTPHVESLIILKLK